MSQPERPPYAVDDLPFIWRIPAAILNYALDLLEARHERSWEQGRDSAHALQNGEVQQGSNEPHHTGASRIIIGYRKEQEHSVPGKDRTIFNASRLIVTAEIKARMRGDCGSFLPANEQPSAEQWKAIFSSAHATAISGAAGTGKSTTLLFRVLLLNRYLGVALDQICLMTFSRESRVEMAAGLAELSSKWGTPLTVQEAQQIVKTPRSAVLELAHSLPDLGNCVPFEVLSQTGAEIQNDGRPFDYRLTPGQQDEMGKCFQQLYLANRRFAELVTTLFGASMQVERLAVDHHEVIKRAPMAWALSSVDVELCEYIEGLWRAAGRWPLAGITSTRKQFTLRGKTYSTNGYIPQLNAHVVLGFDRGEGRHLTRNSSVKTEVYKEVAVKRTLFQAYFPERLIHLDSYQEAQQLVLTVNSLHKLAPEFNYKLNGGNAAVPILEAFNELASIIDTLGLEVATVAGQMNFLPADIDAAFFEALGIYWQALERHLLALPNPCLTFGRLFDMFSDRHADNLMHVPAAALGRFRHLLIDNAEDHGVPTAGWVRGLLSEIRRRDLTRDVSTEHCTSLFVAGDNNQWVFGTRGTSPQHLSDLEVAFPAPTQPIRVVLQDCHRSTQAIVDAGQNLIQNLPPVSGRLTTSTRKVRADEKPVEVWGDDPSMFHQLCKVHYDVGDLILILADSAQDIAWIDAAAGDLIREDRAAGGRRIRVRSYHKSKALEADIVFMVGDPAGGASSWYRNQLYKIAGVSTGGDLTPGDTVLESEAVRLVHVGATRAKKRCVWFPISGSQSCRTASRLVTLTPGLFKDNRE
ncbi:UvrD-helicase domain-containing protein [Pseudomonas sp. NPDC089569]|uniref:UvrD-helicase domain-containing protein n=1 Tax=Pseudomonas sp. NPDC089569 TaxID=3390722 RepID=UPI003D044178